MGIKKIILEEINDFDWVKDVSDDLHQILSDYYEDVVGDYDYNRTKRIKCWLGEITNEEQDRLLDLFYGNGFGWRGGHGSYPLTERGLKMCELIINLTRNEISYNGCGAGGNHRCIVDGSGEIYVPQDQLRRHLDAFNERRGLDVHIDKNILFGLI